MRDVEISQTTHCSKTVVGNSTNPITDWKPKDLNCKLANSSFSTCTFRSRHLEIVRALHHHMAVLR
jgi:hypothetical protein